MFHKDSVWFEFKLTKRISSTDNLINNMYIFTNADLETLYDNFRDTLNV